MRSYKAILAAAILSLLFSCSKEYSQEDAPAAARDCRVSSIVAADSLSGQGFFALNTRFNSGGQGDYVELYDSVRNFSDLGLTLTYRGDSVFSSDNDVFVLDASRRVKRHITPLDPADPGGEKIIYEYTYDVSGFLINKSISTSVFPGPQISFDYTWSGGNLLEVEGNLAGGIRFLSARMEYDQSKSPRNFIYIFPEGVENFLFINALDYGKKPANLIRRITVEYFDDQGQPQFSYDTEIINAKFSDDGYLEEWYVKGDSFDALGIFTGRTRFNYYCK